MSYIVRILKKAYEKYFKSHCPDCGGVMDNICLDMEYDRMIYECRKCKKRWI
jgi:hypothetical protein